MDGNCTMVKLQAKIKKSLYESKGIARKGTYTCTTYDVYANYEQCEYRYSARIEEDGTLTDIRFLGTNCTETSEWVDRFDVCEWNEEGDPYIDEEDSGGSSDGGTCPDGQSLNDDGICVDDCDTSKEDLKEVFPNTSDSTLEEIANALNKYAQDFGLDTKEKLQHFIAQAGHESSNFNRFTELTGWKVSSLSRQWSQHFNPVDDPDKDPNKLDPNDYANSGGIYVDAEKLYNYVYMDENRSKNDKLGNTQEGDGYKYRGRGIWMLTGRDNYEKFNTFYQDNYDDQADIVSNPDLVSEDNKIAIISALWYFENRLNIEIDSDTSVKDVTVKVNGGTNGLTDRENKFEEAKTSIDCI